MAKKENARQGFWNGALPPIGYRIAGEQRGRRTKKTLEIDPFEAETRAADLPPGLDGRRHPGAPAHSRSSLLKEVEIAVGPN